MFFLGPLYRTLECSKAREHSIFALHAFILLPTLHHCPLPRRSMVGSRRSSTAETLPHPWQPPSPPSPAVVMALGTPAPTLPGRLLRCRNSNRCNPAVSTAWPACLPEPLLSPLELGKKRRGQRRRIIGGRGIEC